MRSQSPIASSGRRLNVLAVSAVLTLLVGADLLAQQSYLRDSVTLYPTALGPQCAMLSANGGTTTFYTTAALENNTFYFYDSLPAEAILDKLVVTIATLGSCSPSSGLQVRLNPTLPGVDPDYSLISPYGYYPNSTVTSCETPVSFSTSSRTSKSMLTKPLSPYLKGLLNVLSVTEDGSGCGEVFIEFIKIDFFYYANLPRVTFDLDASSTAEDRMILMHKWHPEYQYLSQYQDMVPQSNKDYLVMVTGSVVDSGGIPQANTDVYLRTTDPPDPSPYMPLSLVHRNDNPVRGGFPPGGSTPWGWKLFKTDSTGRFSALMNTTWYWAGSNQAVEGSTVALSFSDSDTPDGRCSPAIACYRSEPVTQIRRVYLEKDRMFRTGSFLRQSIPPGSTQLPVYSRVGFTAATASNPIPIVIMNTPDFEGWGSYNAADSYYEMRQVIGTGGTNKAPTLIISQPTARQYIARTSSFQGRPAGAAIGKFAVEADLYPLDTTLAIPLMKEAFADYVTLTAVHNPVPFIPFVADCGVNTEATQYCVDIARRSQNSLNADWSVKENHHQLLSSSRGPEGRLGEAILKPRYGSYTYAAIVYHGAIELYTADAKNPQVGSVDPMIVNRETTAHELVHLYDVNQPGLTQLELGIYGTGGHCAAMAWDGGHCLMSTKRTKTEFSDNKVSLHVDPWNTSEYRRIRRQTEPLPREFQTTFEPNP